jgi:hypothetical protein
MRLRDASTLTLNWVDAQSYGVRRRIGAPHGRRRLAPARAAPQERGPEPSPRFQRQIWLSLRSNQPFASLATKRDLSRSLGDVTFRSCRPVSSTSLAWDAREHLKGDATLLFSQRGVGSTIGIPEGPSAGFLLFVDWTCDRPAASRALLPRDGDVDVFPAGQLLGSVTDYSSPRFLLAGWHSPACPETRYRKSNICMKNGHVPIRR